ncbi:MAG TPA: MarC family protein [Caulobacteraceae bacterium]|jgi:multiple antibiotic resistance protein|nr:MarC family protein [Caulobacteraceae bacterium]
MSLTALSVNFFVALFALIDPVGNVALFAAATVGAHAAGRRVLAAYISLFSFVFLAFFFLSGLTLLKFFGISLPAFRIAGGVLLFLLGLDMARGGFVDAMAAPASDGDPAPPHVYARQGFERLVVPFAVPLLIGPGAISTAVIYASETRGFGLAGLGAGLGVIAAVSLTIVISFSLSGLISRALGRIGMTIVIRVLGLILCAMAVQIIIIGVAAATHGLIRHDTAAPYPSIPGDG